LKNIEKEEIFNNKYLDSILVISFCICILPIIFFKEVDIANSDQIKFVLDYFSALFPSIENMAQIAKPHDLYYYVKLQIFFSLVLVPITFLVSFFNFSRLYISSLEYIKKDKKYFLKTIHKHGVLFKSTFHYIVGCVLIFLISDFYLFGNFITISAETLPITNFMYTTKVGIIILSFMMSNTIASGIAVFTIEGIAQIIRLFRTVQIKIDLDNNDENRI